MDSAPIKRLKDSIKEIDAAIENLWKALEHGQSVDMITERIDKRKQEKATLEDQLALEMAKEFILTEPQVIAFLQKLKSSKDDIRRRRSIINIFVSAIYLWDDKFRMVLNGSDKQIVIDDILLDDINEHFDGLNSKLEGCSQLVADAPPKIGKTKLADFLSIAKQWYIITRSVYISVAIMLYKAIALIIYTPTFCNFGGKIFNKNIAKDDTS